MTPDRDEIERLLSLLEAAAEGVSAMSDEEVQAELARREQQPGPSVGEMIAAQLNRVRPPPSITPGSYVRLKSDPARAGVVLAGEKIQAGRRMLPVQFPDGRVQSLPDSALEIVPPAAPPLADRPTMIQEVK